MEPPYNVTGSSLLLASPLSGVSGVPLIRGLDTFFWLIMASVFLSYVSCFLLYYITCVHRILWLGLCICDYMPKEAKL